MSTLKADSIDMSFQITWCDRVATSARDGSECAGADAGCSVEINWRPSFSSWVPRERVQRRNEIHRQSSARPSL